MTIKHGFFASADPENPTTYDQQTYAKRRNMEQTDGILEGVLSELRVTTTDPASMAVAVCAGSVNIQGYWMDSDDIETLQLATADVNNPRIDRVVVRLDTSVNMEVTLAVLTGTPASSPAAPALTRTNYIYELSLAQVYVGVGATYISTSNITDERRNASYCGYTRARYGGVPPGSITSYAGNTVPSGWLLCDGSTLNKNDYPELFSAIGYIYGGSGESFMIPSLVGRMPLGKSSSHPLAETGGSEMVALTIEQMPNHDHSISGGVSSSGTHNHNLSLQTGSSGSNDVALSTVSYGSSTTLNADWTTTGRARYSLSSGSTTYKTGPVINSAGEHTHTLTATIGNTGSGQGHDNMPPFLTLNFIIKT
ncbi:MAG TPA: tail fiber protein [Methanocorpusculum sp.]|nr:tail fiber protein [Methanocorpusculum sp.]